MGFAQKEVSMGSQEKLDAWRNSDKDEKKEKEFDASVIVYGLIFVLYAILFVVLGFFYYRKRQIRNRREDREEKERDAERQKKMMDQQLILLQQQQKLLELQSKVTNNTDTVKVKETTFNNPTEDDIKQYLQTPAPLAEKKES